MKIHTLLAPDSLPGAASQTAKPPRRNKAMPGAAKSRKESRAEECLHELFLLANVDTRSDARARGLVSDIAALVGKKGESHAST